MEQVRDKHKVEHQRYTIQYNDKAIEGLKWNKKLEKRQRIKVIHSTWVQKEVIR